jgi:hypothetical protein
MVDDVILNMGRFEGSLSDKLIKTSAEGLFVAMLTGMT